MTNLSTAPSQATNAKARRISAFNTTTVVSFSLTLLAGSIAVLTNKVPLQTLTLGERIDVGAMLFIATVLALVLAVVFEATRIALSPNRLPEPRRRRVVRNWTPGHREG